MNMADVNPVGLQKKREIKFVIIPLLIFMAYAWLLKARIYGDDALGAVIFFVFIKGFCIVAALVSGFALFRYSQLRLQRFLYFLALSAVCLGLPHFSSHLEIMGLKLRVQHEAQFADCQKAAESGTKAEHYRLCDTEDLGGVTTSNTFRNIVYDSSDAIQYAPCRGSNAWEMLIKKYQGLTAYRHEIISLNGHFYLVNIVPDSSTYVEECDQ